MIKIVICRMIYLITGGQRSGKSKYATELALSLSSKPTYVATSRIWDKEFEARVNIHKSERDQRWENIEEEKYISKLTLENKVVVVDCITLWATNFFYDCKENISKALSEMQTEIDKLTQIHCTLVIVTNEIGMGLHGNSESSRKFTDLQGWTNQYIASKADHVTFMVSGIPLHIKTTHDRI